MDLFDFRMQVADGLTSTLIRGRRTPSDDADQAENLEPNTPKFRRSNQLSQAKRYEGYDHLPSFEAIDDHRTCRMNGCRSRSNLDVKKCDVYLCLSRKQNCFAAYHKKIIAIYTSFKAR
ncbi:unnamed protein product [Parnassius mnemosyne]|uniref:Uncharacterized protein n=1 Tax=Parnassius mnemosyne TaxID=213953 RepID=A0AAV1LYN3_9NEOP